MNLSQYKQKHSTIVLQQQKREIKIEFDSYSMQSHIWQWQKILQATNPAIIAFSSYVELKVIESTEKGRNKLHQV